MRQLPTFHALRAFEAAVRTGSLSGAARDLNVTPGAVSRQISGLEERIGSRLLQRSAQGVAPNDRGSALARRLSAAFDDIEMALRDAGGGPAAETLVLTIYPTFAIQWLVPRLDRFAASAPDVELRIRTSLAEARFDRDEIDAAVMIGQGRWPGLTSFHLLGRHFTPVASPELVHGGGDTAARALVGSRILYSEVHTRQWRLWLERAGLAETVQLERGIRFDTSSLAYQAAREGAGFAMGQPALLRDDLRSGRLIAPFSLILAGNEQYYLACRDGDAERPAIRALVRWMTAELHAEQNDPLTAGSLPVNGTAER